MEEGEATVSALAFNRRMRLLTVIVFSKESVSFFYDDGGLVWDHTIVVDVEAEDRIDRIYLWG